MTKKSIFRSSDKDDDTPTNSNDGSNTSTILERRDSKLIPLPLQKKDSAKMNSVKKNSK